MKRFYFILIVSSLVLMAASCKNSTQSNTTVTNSSAYSSSETDMQPKIEATTYISNLGFQFDYTSTYKVGEKNGVVTLSDQRYDNVDAAGPYINIKISSESIGVAAKKLHAIKLDNDLAVYEDVMQDYGPNSVRLISYRMPLGGHATEALLATKKGTVHFLAVGIDTNDLPGVISSFKLR